MIPEKLYDLLYLYRKNKVLNKIDAEQLYALEDKNGEILYISALHDDEKIGLRWFQGNNGIRTFWKNPKSHEFYPGIAMDEEEINTSYREFSYTDEEDYWDDEQYYLAEEDRIENGRTNFRKLPFPNLRHNEPYSFFIPIEKKDVTQAIAVFEAAFEVQRALKEKEKKKSDFPFCENRFSSYEVPLLRKNGEKYEWGTTYVPSFMEEEYPTAMISNELLLSKLKRKKKLGYAEVFSLRSAIPIEDDDERLQYPVIFYYYLEGEEYPEAIALDDYEKRLEEHLETFAKHLSGYDILPSGFGFCDARTRAFLEPFCEKIGISVLESLNKDQIQDFIEDVKTSVFEEQEKKLMDLDADVPDFLMNPSFKKVLESMSPEDIMEFLEWMGQGDPDLLDDFLEETDEPDDEEFWEYEDEEFWESEAEVFYSEDEDQEEEVDDTASKVIEFRRK